MDADELVYKLLVIAIKVKLEWLEGETRPTEIVMTTRDFRDNLRAILEDEDISMHFIDTARTTRAQQSIIATAHSGPSHQLTPCPPRPPQ